MQPKKIPDTNKEKPNTTCCVLLPPSQRQAFVQFGMSGQVICGKSWQENLGISGQECAGQEGADNRVTAAVKVERKHCSARENTTFSIPSPLR
jgi:hypothetical protein